MSTSSTHASDLEHYVELTALDIMLTSGYALGEAIGEHLRTVQLDEAGLEIRFEGRESSTELYSRLNPDQPAEDDIPGNLVGARVDLLIAKMLRAITPEVVNRAADYFTMLADANLAAYAAGDRSPGAYLPYKRGDDV